MERLMHFSAEPITALDRTRNYGSGYGSLTKPGGFWVSVEGNGDGWSDWCRDEQFSLDRLTYPHEVTLAASARILRITTPGGIYAFTAKYGTDRFPMGLEIDWARVAETYQGILITPYQWSCRLGDGSAWYYGWDCASGCIWDLAAIDSIRVIEPSRKD